VGEEQELPYATCFYGCIKPFPVVHVICVAVLLLLLLAALKFEL